MWTDGQIDTTKLILIFCSFTNVPENRLPCQRGTMINDQEDHRAEMLRILCMWTEFAKKSHKGEKCASSVTITLNFGCKMFKKMGMTFEFLLQK